MTFKLLKRKIKDLIKECQKVKLMRSISVRKLALLIGKIIATTNAILPMRLHFRVLLHDKNYGLKKKGWNGTIQLSEESLIQLEWWISELPKWNGKSLISEAPKSIICTDASNIGWGATWNGQTINGQWNQQEQLLHINQLEMKAIYFALLSFKNIMNQTVLIKTDNTTCIAYINHQGGTISTALSTIAEKLWKLCLKRKINLRAEHIPGILNTSADRASRLKADHHNWMLKPEIFQHFNRI